MFNRNKLLKKATLFLISLETFKPGGTMYGINYNKNYLFIDS